MTNEIKKQFPIFEKKINGNALTYLDTAATSQRPQKVIDAISGYYRTANANPHRGVYTLSMESTDAYEGAREKVSRFIGASDTSELIFVRNTTEAINLVAYSYGMQNIKEGDRIVISIMEHHSNLLPWQNICRAKGAVLEYLYTEDGIITDAEIEKKITSGVKLVALTQVSNVLGIETPYKKIFEKAHSVGALCLLDAAQSVPHMKINVNETGADFVAFSAHKMYGPLGIGALWGKKAILDEMPPFFCGGDMINSVREQDATFAPLPQKFEAGTQNVAGAVGFGAAIDWIEEIGFDTLVEKEDECVDYLLKTLCETEGVTVYGNTEVKHYGSISFNLNGIHPHDTASILDSDGICIRAGHHCAQPLLTYMEIDPCRCDNPGNCIRGGVSCCRASVGVYNEKEDIDRIAESILKVRKWLGYGT